MNTETNSDDVKSLLQSKTFWVNAAIGVVTIADYLAGTGWVNPEILLGITTVANVGLRMLTKSRIGKKSK